MSERPIDAKVTTGYRHELPCQGAYWCLYGLPNFGERGEVATCEECGRTAVCLGSDRWRPETTAERRRRLGLRWWQRTPHWNELGSDSDGSETE